MRLIRRSPAQIFCRPPSRDARAPGRHRVDRARRGGDAADYAASGRYQKGPPAELAAPFFADPRLGGRAC